MKKLWKYFTGKKRNIGIILNSVVTGGMLFFPDFIPPEKGAYILGVINVYLLGGSGHAYARSGNLKKDVASVKNVINVNKKKIM